jgi:DNA-binding MarR family transcriptional regulator
MLRFWVYVKKKYIKKTSMLTNDPEKDAFSASVTSDSMMHAIHQLHMSMERYIEHVLLQKKELSFSQFMILVGFSCENSKASPLSQARLAEHLMLTEATVSRHIKTLVAKGLLTKEKDSYNKKTNNLKVTLEGKRVFERTKKIVTAEIDAKFAHVNEKNKRIIISSCLKTVALLQEKK